MSAGDKGPVTEASITINGRSLTSEQAKVLRTGLRAYMRMLNKEPKGSPLYAEFTPQRLRGHEVQRLMDIPGYEGAEAHVDADTYEPPAHGWTCFHCGDTFTKLGSARDHFGATPAGVPGCIIKAGEERGLLMALRKSEAREDELRIERNRLMDQLEAAQAASQEVLRLVPGAKNTHDVWCYLDHAHGRAEAAEAVIAEIAKHHHQIAHDAMVAVAGPGTYFPEGPGVPLVKPAEEGKRRLEKALEFAEPEFTAWWERHGQFIRAGGGDYEQSFAYRAWEFALKQVAWKLKVSATKVAQPDLDEAESERGVLAQATHAERVRSTLRWAAHVLAAIKPAVASYEHASLERARQDLERLLNLFTPTGPELAPT